MVHLWLEERRDNPMPPPSRGPSLGLSISGRMEGRTELNLRLIMTPEVNPGPERGGKEVKPPTITDEFVVPDEDLPR